MDFKEAIHGLENDNSFREWKQKNSKAFLMSILTIIENENPDEYLLSYFDPSENKVATFLAGKEGYHLKGEEKTEGTPKKIEIEKVKTSLAQAMQTSREALQKRTGEKSQKSIAILQNIDTSQVWNITQMAPNYNVFNSRVDTETGRIVTESYGALFTQA